MHTTVVIAAVLLWLGNGAQVPLDQFGKQGAIDVLVLDSFGGSIEAPDISVQRIGHENKLRMPTGSSRTTVEYGDYRVVVEKSGFISWSNIVKLNAPVVRVVASLAVSEVEKAAESTYLMGSVENAAAYPTCQVIRLVPLLLRTAAVDAEVSGSGNFQIEDLTAGEYAAVLLSSSGICKITTIKVLHRRVQNIVVR